MMKKLLVLLLSAMMAMSLIACGGDTTTDDGADKQVENNVVDDADASGDYTDEQLACIEVYKQMLADYHAAIELANETPALTADEELVNAINEVSATIDEITTIMENPANITDEFIDGVDAMIPQVYTLINKINAMGELLPILTVAGVGVDEENNTYWFACDEEITVAAMVILSADQTQNVACVGEIVDNGDGTCTIYDEEGYTMTMAIEEVEGGLALTMQDGTLVGMVAAEPLDVVDAILAIEEGTENVNEE